MQIDWFILEKDILKTNPPTQPYEAIHINVGIFFFIGLMFVCDVKLPLESEH